MENNDKISEEHKLITYYGELPDNLKEFDIKLFIPSNIQVFDKDTKLPKSNYFYFIYNPAPSIMSGNFKKSAVQSITNDALNKLIGNDYRLTSCTSAMGKSGTIIIIINQKITYISMFEITTSPNAFLYINSLQKINKDKELASFCVNLFNIVSYIIKKQIIKTDDLNVKLLYTGDNNAALCYLKAFLINLNNIYINDSKKIIIERLQLPIPKIKNIDEFLEPIISGNNMIYFYSSETYNKIKQQYIDKKYNNITKELPEIQQVMNGGKINKKITKINKINKTKKVLKKCKFTLIK